MGRRPILILASASTAAAIRVIAAGYLALWPEVFLVVIIIIVISYRVIIIRKFLGFTLVSIFIADFTGTWVSR